MAWNSLRLELLAAFVPRAGLALLAAGLMGCGTLEQDAGDYPSAPRLAVQDSYHGTSVADPYRWLESLDAPETQQWVAAQNQLTDETLAGLPTRDGFAERLATLINYERSSVPASRSGVYVFEYNTGSLEQDVLRVSDDPSKPGRILLDPNTLAADGSISLGGYGLSRDGRWLAYSLSEGGSDWDYWQIRDTKTGEDRQDRIEGTKFSGVAWTADSEAFYYSRYPLGDDGYDDTQQVRIYRHQLGTAQADDELIFAVEDHPTRNPYGTVTEDGRFLVISLFDGYETSGVYYLPLDEAGQPAGEAVRLLDAWDARYEFLGNKGSRFFLQTTRSAPLGRIIGIDLDQPDPDAWLEIVPESQEAIDAVTLAGDEILVTYLKDARAVVRRFSLAGDARGELALPGLGSVASFSGRLGQAEAFYQYTDFTTPGTVYRYDTATADSQAVRRPATDIDPADYFSRQVFVASPDGTRIPLSIVARRDLPPGPRPLVLYGYGGFGVSLLPGYSTARMAWLEAGGVYAVANLRGGGEYGDAWHQAGTRLNKQNVFDDFIAAAEWLIEEELTTPSQLAIWGGSNGGLLVGAVAQQRPELFAAAVPAVGVLDMLRYHLASANARQWSSDYGLSDNADEFAALYAYSPYHRLQPGTCYPATLVMADANDDRVVPWHSYKYAAALQHAQACERPTLIRVETNTGHGAGASTSKIINEYADQWAFIAAMTGLEPA
jgi:prolyl oligopeptidase